MKAQLLSIFTRTPLHVGAGSSVGIVDLPVIRERHTAYPVIPGSSLKGVLADLWPKDSVKNKKGDFVRIPGSEAEFLFGTNDDQKQNEDDEKTKKFEAGNLLVGEARILVFPVRSAKAGFAWCTCPLALGRFLRDAGKPAISFKELTDKGDAMNCIAPTPLLFDSNGKKTIILEEYVLNALNGSGLDTIAPLLDNLSDDPLWKNELKNHLVILSDEMFKYFVENTCEVAQHVKINDEKGTAVDGHLFNQENVPAETMFYTLLH